MQPQYISHTDVTGRPNFVTSPPDHCAVHPPVGQTSNRRCLSDRPHDWTPDFKDRFRTWVRPGKTTVWQRTGAMGGSFIGPGNVTGGPKALPRGGTPRQ